MNILTINRRYLTLIIPNKKEFIFSVTTRGGDIGYDPPYFGPRHKIILVKVLGATPYLVQMLNFINTRLPLLALTP